MCLPCSGNFVWFCEKPLYICKALKLLCLHYLLLQLSPPGERAEKEEDQTEWIKLSLFLSLADHLTDRILIGFTFHLPITQRPTGYTTPGWTALWAYEFGTRWLATWKEQLTMPACPNISAHCEGWRLSTSTCYIPVWDEEDINSWDAQLAQRKDFCDMPHHGARIKRHACPACAINLTGTTGTPQHVTLFPDTALFVTFLLHIKLYSRTSPLQPFS